MNNSIEIKLNGNWQFKSTDMIKMKDEMEINFDVYCHRSNRHRIFVENSMDRIIYVIVQSNDSEIVFCKDRLSAIISLYDYLDNNLIDYQELNQNTLINKLEQIEADLFDVRQLQYSSGNLGSHVFDAIDDLENLIKQLKSERDGKKGK